MEDKFEENNPKLKRPTTLLGKLEYAARLRNLEKHSEESLDWFRTNVGKMFGRERAQRAIIKEQPKARLGSKLPIGKMYCYAYDPKFKETLPYYDRFPLIFYVAPAKGGFFGINLHYLPPKQRAILFDRLLDLKTNPRYSDRTRLKLTYTLLASTQKFKLFKPCFKRYLISHMETKPVEIEYENWEAALFLPIADFQKAKPTQVWSDSILGLR